MRPILFRIGDFAIHSYGVFLAIGFMYGISLAVKEARRLGQDPEKMLDMSFWILIGAIVGSRLFHCFVYWEDYASDPIEILKIWKGGLVFYGGFILATAFTVTFCLYHKLRWITFADAMAPALMLGLLFGRMGCLHAGCCFGKPTDLPWAITFPSAGGLGTAGVPLHPTQMYEALAAFLICLTVLSFRKEKRFEGQPFLVTIVLYAVARSAIEAVRADPRGFIHVAGVAVSESQAVSAVIGPPALILLVYLMWKHRGAPALAEREAQAA